MSMIRKILAVIPLAESRLDSSKQLLAWIDPLVKGKYFGDF